MFTVKSVFFLAFLATASAAAMPWWQAIILGIVEGLTEYLPVSSTGHLLVTSEILGIAAENEEASDAFAIAIQGGAIVAVLGLYWPRVLQMLRGLGGKDPVGQRLVVAMICGFLPAAIIGLTFNDLIRSYLFGMWPIVGAWIVGGIGILIFAHKRKGKDAAEGIDLAEITWKMALVIGFAQCVAMWPGTSRSLMTILGGLFVGLSLRSAVEFSFLLGVLTLGAATCYDTLKHGQLMLDTFGPSSLLLGVVFAFVSAAIAVKWMVGYLNKNGMAIFGYYRIAVGLIVASLLLTGVISS